MVTDDILTAATYAKGGIPTMLHAQVVDATDPNFDFRERSKDYRGSISACS